MAVDERTASLAKRVERALKTCLEIQKDMFTPSIRKVLRIPGIYRPVDYDGHVRALEEIQRDLADMKSGIRDVQDQVDGQEKLFLSRLRGYVSLLLAALEKLSAICARLGEVRRGGTYPKEALRSDVQELQELQKRYLEVGAVLNELIKTLGL
jgi:hypothetical protein